MVLVPLTGFTRGERPPHDVDYAFKKKKNQSSPEILSKCSVVRQYAPKKINICTRVFKVNECMPRRDQISPRICSVALCLEQRTAADCFLWYHFIFYWWVLIWCILGVTEFVFALECSIISSRKGEKSLSCHSGLKFIEGNFMKKGDLEECKLLTSKNSSKNKLIRNPSLIHTGIT